MYSPAPTPKPASVIDNIIDSWLNGAKSRAITVADQATEVVRVANQALASFDVKKAVKTLAINTKDSIVATATDPAAATKATLELTLFVLELDEHLWELGCEVVDAQGNDAHTKTCNQAAQVYYAAAFAKGMVVDAGYTVAHVTAEAMLDHWYHHPGALEWRNSPTLNNWKVEIEDGATVCYEADGITPKCDQQNGGECNTYRIGIEQFGSGPSGYTTEFDRCSCRAPLYREVQARVMSSAYPPSVAQTHKCERVPTASPTTSPTAAPTAAPTPKFCPVYSFKDSAYVTGVTGIPDTNGKPSLDRNCRCQSALRRHKANGRACTTVFGQQVCANVNMYYCAGTPCLLNAKYRSDRGLNTALVREQWPVPTTQTNSMCGAAAVCEKDPSTRARPAGRRPAARARTPTTTP
jgi:hypothetical protein